MMQWAKCSGTSRWGIKDGVPEDEWSNGINNYESIADAINTHDWYSAPDELRKQTANDLIHRLVQVSRWRSFSSTGTNPVPKESDPKYKKWEEWVSLEYLHNNLHGFIGGNDWSDGIGHMENVPVAAFDPIFYMHHANIDRILALWQTVNPPSKEHPESWFLDGDEPKAKDPLPPFHRLDSDTGKVEYFNSNDTQDWTNYGYQYDILARKESNSNTDSEESDQEYINRLTTYISHAYPKNTGSVLLRDKGNLFSHNDIKNSADGGHEYDDYLIDVLYDRYALGGDPYTIHFFIGAGAGGALEATNTDVVSAATAKLQEVNGSVSAFIKHPSWRHVGSVFNFSTPLNNLADDEETASEVPTCPNCAKQHDEGVLSTAMVPLTIALYHAAADQEIGGLNSLGPDDVASYLANQLSWVAVSVCLVTLFGL